MIYRNKKAFTVIEVITVFLLILVVTCLILPKTLNTTKQAKFISKWTTSYSEIQYIFSVIKAQNDLTNKDVFKKAENNEDRIKLVVESIKPYLRIKSKVVEGVYEPIYMDNRAIKKEDKYYFNDFYLTESDEVIGLKWFTENCGKKDVCGIMSFDVNGLDRPNTWGKDIFGINVFEDRIEPIGTGIDMDVLKNDCTRWGQGVYCSYYYLIGGKFD